MKPIPLLVLVAAILAVLWFIRPSGKAAAEAKEIIKAATEKAETLTKQAEATETTTIAARPKVQEARDALKAATEARIEYTQKTVPQLLTTNSPLPTEFIAAEPHPPLSIVNCQLSINSPLPVSIAALEDLPAPILTEFTAMSALIAALEDQIEKETQRGDAWKSAAEAQKDRADAIEENHEAILKSERKKAYLWGGGAGAALAILLMVLL
jgi:hypothetical protein